MSAVTDDGEERVLLVDAQDRRVGTATKLEAHRGGLRHRALSVIICNDRGEMLLQQRAIGKYHSGGLWANACCGHPSPAEETEQAALRRLQEEMGISCGLKPLSTASYRAPVSNGMIEDEVVHLFFGRYAGSVRPNPTEVAACRWIAIDRLQESVSVSPESFAVWFRLYLRLPAFDILAP